MILIVSKYLIPKGFNGFAVYPFVFIKFKEIKSDLALINHEKIHLRQQLELLIILFFIWYGLEFLIRLFQYRNWKIAYKNISFEREAYANEKDLNYMKQRSFLKFLNYCN
jgi:hypothetical protein